MLFENEDVHNCRDMLHDGYAEWLLEQLRHGINESGRGKKIVEKCPLPSDTEVSHDNGVLSRYASDLSEKGYLIYMIINQANALDFMHATRR